MKILYVTLEKENSRKLNTTFRKRGKRFHFSPHNSTSIFCALSLPYHNTLKKQTFQNYADIIFRMERVLL